MDNFHAKCILLLLPAKRHPSFQVKGNPLLSSRLPRMIFHAKRSSSYLPPVYERTSEGRFPPSILPKGARLSKRKEVRPISLSFLSRSMTFHAKRETPKTKIWLD